MTDQSHGNSSISFFGGINEIGGNKFLVEDKGTRIFLDFGMQMGKANEYFGEYLQPRVLNGMGDLFEFGLLPKLKGLYRMDYSTHMKFEDDKSNGSNSNNSEPAYDAIVLTHAHLDHAAYLHYIRPDIPVYCSEPTKLILQALQETGGREEYLIFKKSFQIYKNSKGEMSRGKGEDYQVPRQFVVFENQKSFKIDSIEVEALAVDHSVPGVTGFIIHTSKASIAYTADIRYHGRRAADTKQFVERCGKSDIDYMLCEGTRVQETESRTEMDVEADVKAIVKRTKELVVCTYPPRDLDRLLSFYNAARDSERYLVIDMKQAYMLKLFQTSETWKKVVPRPDDKRIKIYVPKKSWGLLGRADLDRWTEKQLMQDYDLWEREFLDYPNSTDYQDVSANQRDFLYFCSDYQLHQLIDIRPASSSSYIRSLTEPFDDEMELKEEKVKRWLAHFGLISSEKDWNHSHVSGHGSGDQIRKVIDGTKAKALIPIHTEHEEYHKKWHSNVISVENNSAIAFNN